MSNIPAGSYIGRATGDFDFSTTSGGKEQAVARFEIIEGEFAGRTVNFYGSLSSPESQEITVRQLRDAGWRGDDWLDIGPQTGLGSVDVKISIKYETYNGKERMKVGIWPVNGGDLVRDDQKLDDGRKAALAARLKGLAVKTAPKAGGGRGAAGGGAAPAWASKAGGGAAPWNQPPASYERQPGDDDIPY